MTDPDNPLSVSAAADPDQRLEQWLHTATQYFVLSNAGAAVAVLSFIGASIGKNGSFAKIAILPLLFFVAGLVVAGLVILGQLTGAYRAWHVDPSAAEWSIRQRWTTRLTDRVEPRTGSFLWSAFILFGLGALTGLIALACA